MGLVVEVSGLGCVEAAEGLRGDLVRALGSGVSEVGVERSGGDVAAWVSVAAGVVQAAGVVWSWWQSRDREGPLPVLVVTVVLADGERVVLSGVDGQGLLGRVEAVEERCGDGGCGA